MRYSLIHPRCGTSFLFWVVVLSAFVYAPFGRLSWEWIIVTRKIQPLIAAQAAAAPSETSGVSPAAR